MRYGQDNSVFANMDMYRIENVVCYPFRTATLVDNETIEGQIGEGCRLCNCRMDGYYWIYLKQPIITYRSRELVLQKVA